VLRYAAFDAVPTEAFSRAANATYRPARTGSGGVILGVADADVAGDQPVLGRRTQHLRLYSTMRFFSHQATKKDALSHSR